VTGSSTFRLEPPRLRTTADPDEERHATWFELYFDLVFVAAVGELATALAADPTAATFGRFAGLFTIVTWAWAGFTLYANRFDTDDLVYRLTKSLGMLAIAALAINVHLVMKGDGGTVGFAAGFVVLRLLLVALYLRARRHVTGDGLELINRYLPLYSLTTALWLLSIFCPEPYRVALWAVAIAIDMCGAPLAWRRLAGAPVAVSHLTERFGIFFIIVLGEAVTGVVAGVSGFEFSSESWVIAGICFAIALILWWIYFDLADTSVVGRGALGFVYPYSHLPLFAGVAAFGAGTHLAITNAASPGLPAGARWALAGGIALFALALSMLHIGAEWTSVRDRTFLGRLALVAFAVGLAALGGGLAPIVFAGLIAAAVLAQLLLEAATFDEGAASVWEPSPKAVITDGAVGET
jgi:low temperature requirement protein LtrA